MKKPPLAIQIIIGLILGILWALISSSMGWSSFTIDWIAPIGEIFIRLLKLIAIPLVLFSIISGISGLNDTATLGRMGIKTLGLYIASTVIACCVGLFFANTFKPGHQAAPEQLNVNRLSYEIWVNETDGVEFFDDIRLTDDSQFSSYLSDARQNLDEQRSNEELNKKIAAAASSSKKTGPLQFFVDMVPSNIFVSFNGSLMLQIIFFSLFFGVTLVALPKERTTYMVGFIDGGTHVFIKMVDIIMKGAPVFVFALLAGKLAEMAGDEPSRLIEIFKALGAYTMVTIFALLLMIFVFYPAIVAALIHRKTKIGFIKAWKYFSKGIRPAQILAFSTSSTAATLPVTMDCVRDNLGVDEEVGSFVLPVGATVNMDGTALYQSVAVIFMAQFHLIDLTIIQQVTIIFTATLASIGAASVPSAGLIMLIVVLESVGLNPAWIAIIFPVDRIIDMVRTMLNLTGDASVSVIIGLSEDKMEIVDSE
ncbi:MAG: dicarboxylate/amino acid:cation symporter [Schleiferiaceae bacterium]|jgi:Na+/H+-dicarboxylate symporter|nr:dicarboxylate/amino acid:cation symporter [Flavobacteriales bacterium]MDA9256201.1 dicarboxylate/amino acid:cation symporter [Schleiferiaceae bacterium]MBT3677543.1 dicarboxylate/amino acid:cation symporter [Flavobacteriales bacterium]MBT3740546.1 dicarboxylate/amino acid:cation symporter [Flavobacteriales bacterium]MBT4201585.1 dicarboxylate/amino acid:cation symporter [Flavobacteriales bacterium]